MRARPPGANRPRPSVGLICAGFLLISGPSRAEDVRGTDPFPNRVEVFAPETPNTLAKADAESGWRLLFDGKEATSWRAASTDDFPETGWKIEEGVLSVRSAGRFEFRAGGDLFSRERFGDFILDFEFRLSEGANSGVKYAAEVQKQWGFIHSLGCEYQLLDDERHPDARQGRDGNRTLASLYDLIPANARNFSAETELKPFRGIGVWNHGRVHVERGWIVHYLNGRKVLSLRIGSERWDRALATSKFADRAMFCGVEPGRKDARPTSVQGHLVLQDHGDSADFRNLRILPLD